MASRQTKERESGDGVIVMPTGLRKSGSPQKSKRLERIKSGLTDSYKSNSKKLIIVAGLVLGLGVILGIIFDNKDDQASNQPDSSPSELQLSEHLLKNGKNSEAIEGLLAYADQAKTSEDKLSAYIQLGYGYALEKDLDHAVEFLTKALTINPDDYGVNVALGGIYSQQGKTAEATDHYKKAIVIARATEYVMDDLEIPDLEAAITQLGGDSVNVE